MTEQDQHLDFAEYLNADPTDAPDPRTEAHLDECSACRVELAELRQLEEMLSATPDETLLEGAPDDADLLLARTLREVRTLRGEDRPTRVSRPALLLSAAATVAVALVAGAIAARSTAPDSTAVAQAPPPGQVSSTPPGPGTTFVNVADPISGARLTAHVVPMAGWVRVQADVAGVPAGERCRLVVVGADGHREVAGSWLVSPQGAAKGTSLMGAAVVDPGQVRSVVVENTTGRQFVSARV